MITPNTAAALDLAENVLQTLANWREGCHNHDADMGNPLREFGEESIEQLEAQAAEALVQFCALLAKPNPFKL